MIYVRIEWFNCVYVAVVNAEAVSPFSLWSTAKSLDRATATFSAAGYGFYIPIFDTPSPSPGISRLNDLYLYYKNASPTSFIPIFIIMIYYYYCRRECLSRDYRSKRYYVLFRSAQRNYYLLWR